MASENVDKHTSKQDSCLISIDRKGVYTRNNGHKDDLSLTFRIPAMFSYKKSKYHQDLLHSFFELNLFRGFCVVK